MVDSFWPGLWFEKAKAADPKLAWNKTTCHAEDGLGHAHILNPHFPNRAIASWVNTTAFIY